MRRSVGELAAMKGKAVVLLHRWLRQRRRREQAPATPGRTVILSRAQHNISRRNIDPDAVRVLQRLSGAGHVAYLVGGGVRDLLLERAPKDFDVSTSAHPNQIKSLFRNCFLIGRRFRLAHIKFGAKVIETSTFRRQPDPSVDPRTGESSLYQHRDNTFGTPEEDARRRDFTINGLFYDIKTFSVIDHVGGLKDLEQRLIRAIGDPGVRFQEDPVRMLRAVRFAARLDFTIEPATRQAILKHHHEIEKAASARVLEELQRLFAYQSGTASLRLMRELRLLGSLLPEVDAFVDRSGDAQSPLWAHLDALDRGPLAIGKPSPALIMAALFAPLFDEQMAAAGCAPTDHQARQAAAEAAIRPAASRMQWPRQLTYDVTRMLVTLQRFEQPQQARTLAERLRRAHPAPGRPHPYFRASAEDPFLQALSLFEVRVMAAGRDEQLLRPWHAVAQRAPTGLAPEAEEADGVPVAEEEGDMPAPPLRRRPRRRTRRPRGRGENPDTATTGGHPADLPLAAAGLPTDV